MFFNPRQVVSLYLFLTQAKTENFPELLEIQQQLSRELCKYLSIAQFEQLQALYTKGYSFEEIQTR